MPAMQMDKADHAETRNHGSAGDKGRAYRQTQLQMIENGRYRDAVAKDYWDMREKARKNGYPRQYNEGMLEKSSHRNCLEKHGPLPEKAKGR